MLALLERPVRARFDEVVDAVSALLSAKYGLAVEVCSPRNPNTAAAEIANLHAGKVQLSATRPKEQQGFVLAHIFGHLVQHLEARRYAPLVELIESPPPIAFTPAQEDAYFEFEMEASAWGEAAMRACMPVTPELLQRFRAYVLADHTSYLSYLKTGLQTEPAAFQRAFAHTAATPIGKIWDSGGLVLPQSLSFEDVDISVL